MARTHSHGGVVCEHATIKACTAARRLAMGKCTSLVGEKEDIRECPNWAIDKIEERGYCGQHLNSAVLRADERQRLDREQARIQRNIDHYIAWTAVYPSFWDKLPEGWRDQMPFEPQPS